VFAWKDSCEFQAERVAHADAAGAESVLIRSGGGHLKVTGRAGATGLDVRGIACARDMGLLAASTVSVHRDGKVIYVEVRLAGDDRSLVGTSPGMPYMDVEISLPIGVAVQVDDWVGGVQIEAARKVLVRESSGDIEIRGVSGSVTIERVHASRIHVAHVGGDLTARRGTSGRIDYEAIRGKVVLPDRGND